LLFSENSKFGGGQCKKGEKNAKKKKRKGTKAVEDRKKPRWKQKEAADNGSEMAFSGSGL
jgi:hypothetical protein